MLTLLAKSRLAPPYAATTCKRANTDTRVGARGVPANHSPTSTRLNAAAFNLVLEARLGHADIAGLPHITAA